MPPQPARAVYDQLDETLTSTAIQLRQAQMADAGMPALVRGASGPSRRAGGTARRMSGELGAVLLDTLGLAASIEWHARRFQKSTGIVCVLAVKHAAPFEPPEDCADTVFDIYSEALSNVARHAGASTVAIALTLTPQAVAMAVRDNGIGLGDEAAACGAGGLAAIQARAQSCKGVCEIAGARDAGTAVAVSLPVA